MVHLKVYALLSPWFNGMKSGDGHNPHEKTTELQNTIEFNFGEKAKFHLKKKTCKWSVTGERISLLC